MRIAVVVALALTACSFHGRAHDGVDGVDATVGDDAPTGDAVDADGRTCASVDGLLGHRCLAPTGDLAFDGPTFDTTADPRCDASVLDVCVVAAATITTASQVTITGSRPLVLFAAQTIHVIGALDVSSKYALVVGAGANPSSCTMSTTPPTASNLGAGGGAGGSFGGLGGDGGTGNANMGGGQPVKLGGTAALVAAMPALRGGCPGQRGADGNEIGDGGVPGDGGGALYLFAAGAIAIDGDVRASGAGGGGGLNYGGGGGGGSGGLVGFESPTITVTGTVVANGGGGGGGGSVINPLQGGPGGDGATSPFDGIALGGSPGYYAGPGGAGSSVVTPVGGQSVAADAGGGGGGGGVGVVWVKGAFTGVQVSPAPQLH